MARLRLGVVGLIAALLVGGFAAAPHRSAATSIPADPMGRLPHPSRVAVLVLENRDFGQVIGNRAAPYINRLARRYALATRYYAIGHPSVPNYMALTGGSTFGLRHDCNRCDAEGRNLMDQLNAAGISWKAYFENLPSGGRFGLRTAVYNKHYNPFAYYEDFSGNATDRSRVVSFTALHRQLASGQLPRFSWIAPNLVHDGHYASIRESDRYVSKLVPSVIRALGPRGVLYVTWDEGAPGVDTGVRGTAGGGRVPLIAAGGAAMRGARVSVPANHYALLRTIEGGFGLSTLQQSGSGSTPLLSGLLRRS
jgi:hypothetical protein